MSDVLYLAWRYLACHRVTTAILVGSIALIIFVPAGLRVLVGRSETQLAARADATPLVLGRAGSPLELVLSSLYFAADVPETLSLGDAEAIDDSDLARAIPLHVRFRAGDAPIVGTTLEYFEQRGLRVAGGRMLTRLGDCVLGAAVARRRDLGPGDTIVSSPQSVFDLAGVYPLRMRITGVLAEAGNADDHAVFADLSTAWVIEGLGHGHQDLARPAAAAGVLSREDGKITANASVVQYTEITDDNIGSFHFHGDRASFPITAVIAVPPDRKSTALLLGRYQDHATLQLARPMPVMDELLGTILTVQHLVVAALVGVGGATAATAVLVFWLSIRLRRREIDTMVRIGAARGRVAAIIATEIATVILLGVTIAAGLTAFAAQYGTEFMRRMLLS